MIEYLHVVKKEAMLISKHVSFDGSKVRWWDPNLFFHSNEVDEAALDVADDYKDEHNVKTFELTFGLHGLL